MSTRQLLATGEKTAVRHHSSKPKQRASGFTLIEVMIALAIFVIGALAIVRIFPPALNAIQGSESRSIAMNRSRGFLARSTAQQGLIPDSIYDAAANLDWVNYPGSVTGTTTRNTRYHLALTRPHSKFGAGAFQAYCWRKASSTPVWYCNFTHPLRAQSICACCGDTEPRGC
jgi:prepilin-type N-terminal cleavage/methylation domain-containing protein